MSDSKTENTFRKAMKNWIFYLFKNAIFFLIEFPADAKRPDLWLLAKAKAAAEPRFKVDDMIKEAGHDVLRLPPYHCDLNPIGILHFWRENSNSKYDFLLQKTSDLV